MGFIIHFYIIFGTNLLTQGLVQIAWLVIGVVHDESILCDENEAWPNYMIL